MAAGVGLRWAVGAATGAAAVGAGIGAVIGALVVGAVLEVVRRALGRAELGGLAVDGLGVDGVGAIGEGEGHAFDCDFGVGGEMEVIGALGVEADEIAVGELEAIDGTALAVVEGFEGGFDGDGLALRPAEFGASGIFKRY